MSCQIFEELELGNLVQNNCFDNKDYSMIWNILLNNFHWIKTWLAWDIGNEEKLRVGIDPFIGDNGNLKLHKGITGHLEVLNLTTLNKI